MLILVCSTIQNSNRKSNKERVSNHCAVSFILIEVFIRNVKSNADNAS